MCTRINKNKNDGDLSILLPRPFLLSLKAAL